VSDSGPSDIAFHKSTFSEQGTCVEVGRTGGVIQVRDTKAPNGSALSFSAQEWAAFVAGVKAGEFDDEGCQ
jgi:hypothetical protein